MKTTGLTIADILPGRCFEAKRPSKIGFERLLNDRQVTWVNSTRTEVQYDSITVKNGRRLPIVSMDTFLKWAKRDVSELMPKGDWRKE